MKCKMYLKPIRCFEVVGSILIKNLSRYYEKSNISIPQITSVYKLYHQSLKMILNFKFFLNLIFWHVLSSLFYREFYSLVNYNLNTWNVFTVDLLTSLEYHASFLDRLSSQFLQKLILNYWRYDILNALQKFFLKTWKKNIKTHLAS